MCRFQLAWFVRSNLPFQIGHFEEKISPYYWTSVLRQWDHTCLSTEPGLGKARGSVKLIQNLGGSNCFTGWALKWKRSSTQKLVIGRSEKSPPIISLRGIWLVYIAVSHASLWRRPTGAVGTPVSRGDVVVIHAADTFSDHSLVRKATCCESSPRMELSSDRAVARLEMSQIQSEDGEPFNESSDGDYESLPPHVSVTTHMTAGAVAGILEHTVMYPVDSVKVTPSSEAARLFLFSPRRLKL